MDTYLQYVKAKMTLKMRRTIAMAKRIKFLSLVCWHGGFVVGNDVAKKIMVKSPETQIKIHHTQPIFWAAICIDSDLDLE